MPSDDSDRTVRPGTQLNGIYEIDERIAFGGMGEIYRGHNIQTHDPVAIKIVLPEFARDETILALFKKEARILSHVSHDAIVRYHVFSMDPGVGRPYLAMEFVDGESLADHLKRGAMDAPTVRRLISRIASGLSAAHEAGVIHRDLSPDNIILPGSNVEKAKIIDFGIAKSANVGGGTLLGGKFAGKYDFVSPEQLGDYGGEVTARSDIYSLGLVMAAALRGKPLDMGGSQVDVIEKRRKVPDLRGLDPELTPLLEAMLQPDPRNRPSSMEAIVQRLAASAGTAAHPAAPAPAHEPDPAPARGGGHPAPFASSAPGENLQTVVPRGGALPAAGSWQGATQTADFWPGSIPPATSMPPVQPASLRLATGQEPRPASESPFGPYVPPAQPVSLPPPPPSRFAAAPRRRSRGWLTSLLVIVVLAAGLAAAYFTGNLERLPALPGVTTPLSNEQAGETTTPVQQPATTAAQQPAPAEQEASVDKPAHTPAVPPPQNEAAVPPQNQAAVPPPQNEAALPPQKPTAAEASGPVDVAAQRVAWLRSYQGGDCFYAAATDVSDKQFSIEGFGTSVEPFQALLKAFKDAEGIEPDIGVRLIERPQCAVADFLEALKNTAPERPVLTLSKDIIRSGDTIRGALDKVEGRTTQVLLVDNEGLVHSLGQSLRRSGEQTYFNISLGLATDVPVPQMVVALVSPNGVLAADIDAEVPAARLFPRILDEIRASHIDASATAKYFKIGG